MESLNILNISCNSGNFLEPVSLLCEYAVNPIGIETLKPRFSWKVDCNERGQYQSAYQIIVASSLKKLDDNLGDLWDSGIVKSNQSINIVYCGTQLKSRQRCYYKIKIWDKSANESRFSNNCTFEMGLINPDDWKAKWIGSPVFGAEAPLFRKEFTVRKNCVKARVYISGLGYYELFINGKRVGDHVLDPAWTDYGKRVLYAVYSVEDFLETGSNAIGVMLGAGWYTRAHLNSVHTSSQLLFQLELEYEDGSVDCIVTGPQSGWKVCNNSPVIYSSIYNGEMYDARLEKENWHKAGFEKKCTKDEMKGWENPLWMEPPGGRMVSQMIEAIKVVDDIKPISVSKPHPGIYVFDIGQNISGWAKLQVRAVSGSRITMRYAELLYDNGTVNQENLRTAKATDIYIAKGNGLEVYEPHFTYHGFRYVQVEGLADARTAETTETKAEAGVEAEAVEVEAEAEVEKYGGSISEIVSVAITGRVVHSSVEQIGSFRCGNSLLNKIQENILWTEANNLYGLPTDCPQRDERLGWLNDMTVRAEEAIYNFNVARLFTKWENDIADTQGEATGAIADTAPFHFCGRRPADPVCSSYLLIPWLMYLHYGDRHILEEHYEGMKKWVDYLGIHTNNFIIEYSSYGDWASPITQSVEGSIGAGALSEKTPGKLISTGYYYYNLQIMAKISQILGKIHDVHVIEEMLAKVGRAFNETFLNRETNNYAMGSQASNVLALFLDLVPKEKYKDVLENLITDILLNNNVHLTTGNLCTKYLLEVLSDAGRADVAFLLATQETYPGWGYMIAKGATTIWERWEFMTSCSMASHNHPMYGSISTWFYKMIGGINVDPECPGFENIIIKPYIIDKLLYAESNLNSIRGLVKSGWKLIQDGYIIEIKIPFNSEAWVYIPLTEDKRKYADIYEGHKKLWEYGRFKCLNNDILDCKLLENSIAFKVGSGYYNFMVTFNT